MISISLVYKAYIRLTSTLYLLNLLLGTNVDNNSLNKTHIKI